MTAKTTEAQLRASKKYHQSKTEIKATIERDAVDTYRKYAASKNMSVSNFVKAAIDEYMVNHP